MCNKSKSMKTTNEQLMKLVVFILRLVIISCSSGNQKSPKIIVYLINETLKFINKSK